MTTPSDDILDLLTAYALDALEPEEITHVHALLARHPELRTTLAELRSTVDILPHGLPEAAPAPELRQRVLDYATGRAERQPAAPVALPRRVRGWLLSLGGLATAALVAAAIGWGQAATLRGDLAQTQAELVRSRGDLAQTQAELVRSRGDLAQTQAELVRSHEDLATVQAVVASLQGTSGQGTMVRTSAGNTVFVVKLPQLEPGRTYQLWRMHEDIAPLSVGLFTVDQHGYATLDLGEQPQIGEIVGVTDEPQGGSPGPTGEPLIAGPVQST
jgi:anti-sigma-K factor RskA